MLPTDFQHPSNALPTGSNGVCVPTPHTPRGVGTAPTLERGAQRQTAYEIRTRMHGRGAEKDQEGFVSYTGGEGKCTQSQIDVLEPYSGVGGGETGAMSANPYTGGEGTRTKTRRKKDRAARKSSADRQRRYRARRNAGVEVVAVHVDAVALAERLIEAGLLAEGDADDKGMISAALSGVVRFWLGSDA